MVFNKFVFSHFFKYKTKVLIRYFCHKNVRKPPWKVLFFGADSFSVYSLQALTQEYRKGRLISKLEVVTTFKGKPNNVKVFSEENNLRVHNWPVSVTYGEFDVGLVVSFGHLIPKNIIKSFEFGMLNVHASLLPRWRGAAPIIYAIAKGDTKTGITIMKISPEKFDIGEIVRQETVEIPFDMKMRELHSILGKLGAKNLVETLETLPLHLNQAKPQPSEGVTYAPKINSEISRVKWEKMTSKEVFDLSRALDGIFHLQTSWNGFLVKLVNISKVEEKNCSKGARPGYIEYDKESKLLKVLCADFQSITVEKIGVSGKKIITSIDFNNGYIKKQQPNSRYFK